jgi:hypothetical protein
VGTENLRAQHEMATTLDVPAAWLLDDAAPPSAPEVRRLGGLTTRARAPDGAWLRLGARVALGAWALLVFVLVCVAVARLHYVPRPSAACADANACSRDLDIGGGCVHVPVADGTPCAADPLARCYDGVDVPTCLQGACVGRRCAGACQRTSDCPPIQVRGAPKSATCVWGSCIYAEQAQAPIVSTQCSSDVYRLMCEALLTPSATRPCLRTSSYCEAGQLVCLYTFACIAQTNGSQ